MCSLAFRPTLKPGEQPQPDLWGRATIEEIMVLKCEFIDITGQLPGFVSSSSSSILLSS
jgi:hypothetical protein